MLNNSNIARKHSDDIKSRVTSDFQENVDINPIEENELEIETNVDKKVETIDETGYNEVIIDKTKLDP